MRLWRQKHGGSINRENERSAELLERRQRFAGGLRGGGGTRRVEMNRSGLVAAEAADSGEILGD